MSLVDLHTHTTESDGTFTPEELIQAADARRNRHARHYGSRHVRGIRSGVGWLAAGIELIRGIELTCQHTSGNVHLLGYFFNGGPQGEFVAWLNALLDSRRDRNRRLERRLQELGLDVHLEEAEQYGRRITGRPHFARVLVAKGYAANLREAFDKYVGELGQAYVERESPAVAEAIERILAAGGVPSLAHPIRIRGDQESAIAEFAAAGLPAIEAFHSDQGQADTQRYLALAGKYGLSCKRRLRFSRRQQAAHQPWAGDQRQSAGSGVGGPGSASTVAVTPPSESLSPGLMIDPHVRERNCFAECGRVRGRRDLGGFLTFELQFRSRHGRLVRFDGDRQQPAMNLATGSDPFHDFLS